MFLADVAEEEIVEGADVGVGPLPHDVYGCVGVEQVFDRGEYLPPFVLAVRKPLDLHQLVEFLLDFEVLDRILLVAATPFHLLKL